ncbi:MAG: hypothetical protein CVV21_03605 [Candidatus Goldiibacteriota bacterium HGW-Goldbacteria-1]|nr:MAG: hypothetical protein CVV21_03605 [Candidatus Goldiibacteriota bacterium HGW-Goldbacteria-1]
MKRKMLVLGSVLLVLMFLAGCGKPFHKQLDEALTAGNYQAAVDLIEAEKLKPKENVYSEKNEILYYMDKGAVLQVLKEYEESCSLMSKADELVDKLYTKSVLDETAAFLSSDLNIKYRGEDFESVMLSIVAMLNYMYQGQYEKGVIESRKVNNKLKYFEAEYGDKAIYTEDPLARYLAGFCYEASGYYNEAYIDYKLAAAACEKYESIYGVSVPEIMKASAVSMAEANRFEDDVEYYKSKWGALDYTKKEQLAGNSEVLLVIYDGLPAYKVEDKNFLTGIALPKYQKRDSWLEDVEVKCKETVCPVQLVQDQAAISYKNLETKNGIMMLKGVGRGVAKTIMKNIPLGSLFVGEERADTRCWRTIPSRFHLVRIKLAPGQHEIKVTLKAAPGDKLHTDREEIITTKLVKGQKKVYPVYAF